MADIPVGNTEKDAVPTYRGSTQEIDPDAANIALPEDELPQHVGAASLSVEKAFTGIPRPFAGVDGSFDTKGGIKEKATLISRMKNLVPYKFNNEGKRGKVTPLTQMYLVRYLGPLLYDNAGQALMKQKITPEKKSSSKKQARERLQRLIRQVDELDAALASESKLEMDVLFPFLRLKTLLSDGVAPMPEFKTGMVQQYYSGLNADQKKKFRDVLRKLPGGLPTQGEKGALTLEDRYHLPIMTMIEELQDKGQKATKLTLLDDPGGEKRIPLEQGSALTSYGMNILLAEEGGRHGIAESMLSEYPVEWEELEDFDGVGYLMELIIAIYDLDDDNALYALQSLLTTEFELVIMNMGTKTESATAVIMDDDNEVRIGLNLLSGNSIGSASGSLAQEGKSAINLDGKSFPEGPRLPGCVVLFNLAVHMRSVLTRKKLVYKTYTGATTKEREFSDEDLAFRMEAFDAFFGTTYDGDKLVGVNGAGTFNPGNISFDNGRMGYCTILSSTGSEESAIDPAEARLFNAVGQVVETIMLDNAVEAARGTKEFPSHTRYDETINALVGNSKAIGIATYHAQFHFNMLLNQLQAPFKDMNVEGEAIVGGRLLAIEAYFGDPAKLMLYWMLNFRDYLDWGSTADDGTPMFFQAPLDANTRAEIAAKEKNKLSHLILSYYRLSFAMLATKEVVTTKGKKPKGAADIKAYWTKLLSDSRNDPPTGSLFVQMLAYAFGSIGEESRRNDIPYASWLPPPTQTANMTTKDQSANLVSKYLKWAYGQKPLDITWFGEVAAVYHAAKAISMTEDYPSMVEGFVEAVAADGGHAFLFAVLLHELSERNSIPEEPQPLKVEITGAYIGKVAKVGEEATPFTDDDDDDDDATEDSDDSDGRGPSGPDEPATEGPTESESDDSAMSGMEAGSAASMFEAAVDPSEAGFTMSEAEDDPEPTVITDADATFLRTFIDVVSEPDEGIRYELVGTTVRNAEGVNSDIIDEVTGEMSNPDEAIKIAEEYLKEREDENVGLLGER